MFIVLGLKASPKTPCIMGCTMEREDAIECLNDMGDITKEMFEMPTETVEVFVQATYPVIQWLANALDVEEEDAENLFGKLLDASSDYMEQMLDAHKFN